MTSLRSPRPPCRQGSVLRRPRRAITSLAAALAVIFSLTALPSPAESVPLDAKEGRGPNRVYFGQDIYVAASQRIHNAVCVFCSVQVEGELTGGALVLFGNATVAGRVDRSVTVVGGNAVVDAEARILGRTAVIAGNAVYEAEESLSGDALVMGGHVSNLAGPRSRSSRRLAMSPVMASGLVLLGLLLLTPFWFPRRASAARGPG